eukprot:g3628.t1
MKNEEIVKDIVATKQHIIAVRARRKKGRSWRAVKIGLLESGRDDNDKTASSLTKEKKKVRPLSSWASKKVKEREYNRRSLGGGFTGFLGKSENLLRGWKGGPPQTFIDASQLATPEKSVAKSRLKEKKRNDLKKHLQQERKKLLAKFQNLRLKHNRLQAESENLSCELQNTLDKLNEQKIENVKRKDWRKDTTTTVERKEKQLEELSMKKAKERNYYQTLHLMLNRLRRAKPRLRKDVSSLEALIKNWRIELQKLRQEERVAAQQSVGLIEEFGKVEEHIFQIEDSMSEKLTFAKASLNEMKDLLKRQQERREEKNKEIVKNKMKADANVHGTLQDAIMRRNLASLAAQHNVHEDCFQVIRLMTGKSDVKEIIAYYNDRDRILSDLHDSILALQEEEKLEEEKLKTLRELKHEQQLEQEQQNLGRLDDVETNKTNIDEIKVIEEHCVHARKQLGALHLLVDSLYIRFVKDKGGHHGRKLSLIEKLKKLLVEGQLRGEGTSKLNK